MLGLVPYPALFVKFPQLKKVETNSYASDPRQTRVCFITTRISEGF